MRIILLICIMLSGLYSLAAVVVVDKSGNGDFTTFPSAFAGTSAGDTIYVLGSGTGYGNATLSSPRVIIGNGYFGQSLGYSPSTSFSVINLNAGSAGSKLIGITATSISWNDSNVSFESCHITGAFTVGASITNASFLKCYFTSTLNIQGNGVSIENSIFNFSGAGNTLNITGGVEVQLSYNTFYDGNLSLDTAIVNNCIVNSSLVTQTPSIIIDGQFGNKVETEANLLFASTGANTDRFFQLQGGSSALASSDEGAESGAFGFPSGQPELAYALSGVPRIPNIVGLGYASVANTSSNLDISVQAVSDGGNINEISIGVYYDGSPLDVQSFNAFTPSASIDETVTLNTSLYAPGLHYFTVEVISETGVKNIYESGVFLQEELIVSDANVTDLEYFFDSDPGRGLGTQIVISPSTEISITENLNTSGLAEGFHTLYLRAKDQTGRWGSYATSTIYVESSIGVGDVVQVDALEYFVDTDPGPGLATPISTTTNTEVSLIENLSLSGLTSGFHTIYLRGRLLNGTWGPYSATTIYVESTIGVGDVVVIDELEYFIDTDPGAGQATAIAISSGSEVSATESIDLSGLSTGFHTLYLRGKLANGTWGPYTSQSIYLETSTQGSSDQIVALEYFFDTDPGVGAALVANGSTPATSLNENVSLDASGLSAGTHTVSFRAKDESGSWGHYQTQTIEVLAGSLVESIADGNWDDPNTWSTSTVPTSIDSVAIKNVITLNVATDTVLALTIASSGTLDLSGNDVHVRGRFTAQASSSYTPNGGSLFLDGGSQTYTNVGNITHGNLIFGGTGTKTIANLSTDNIAVQDSLHVESGVSLAFSENNSLSLQGTADFVSEGSISTLNKWSLLLNGTSHLIEGGDFENVTFQSAATLNINSDFNYDGDFNTGTLGTVINLGSNEINLGSTWSVSLSDVFNYDVAGRLRVENSVIFSMEADVPLVTVDANTGTFTANGNLTFGTDQFLIIESGIVNLNSASFSGSGGINLSGGSLNVTNSDLTFGTGSFLANDGGIVTILGSSTISGTTSSDAYTFVNSTGSLTLSGTSISEVGGLGLGLFGGTVSMTNVSFTNGLGVSYITFDEGFDGATYEGIFFENGPAFNVSINDGVASSITFDQYGGAFGGPNFDNPGTTGTINWTNPQGVGSITVITPNGGEELSAGDNYEIIWSTENIDGSELIEISWSQDGGETFNFVDDGTFDTYNGVYNWTVPSAVGSTNQIQIRSTTSGASDLSDGIFTIVELQGSITVITPNGGEELNVGDNYEITWSTVNIDGSELIEISWSQDGGETFNFVDDGTFDTYNGVYNWTVPSAVGSTNQIQIISTTSDVSDLSDGLFSILETGGAPVANEASNITSTSFTASWSNTGTGSYFVDVSTEADFASFVANYEDAATTNTSLEITGLDFGQSYFYRVRSDDSGTLSENSNTVSTKTTIDSETTADSTALVQIYTALGGASWSPAVNWETARLRDWNRVELNSSQTRVEDLALGNLGLAGDMPNPFTGDAVGGLSELLGVDLRDNELTGLMDFLETSITSLNVSGNNLQFDDLEPLVGITTRDFSNQASIKFNEYNPEIDSIRVRYTNDFNLSVTIGGTANQFQWKRNGNNITTGVDFSDNGNNLDILSIDYDNMGEFTAEVTSTIVLGLTINVDPQKVFAMADMTVEVRNNEGALLPERVNGFLYETTRLAKGYTLLETQRDVTSTFTFPDVVLGNYIMSAESDETKYIPTYFGEGNIVEWDKAEVVEFRDDRAIQLEMTTIPPPLNEGDGDGTLDIVIEEDFGDGEGRVDARRRAARRKCGLRRKRTGGRTEVDEDGFELIAYGETDENGEFQFDFLPAGTYRFFVEYPGIPLDDASFVEFVVGEAGISNTDFKLEAFATENGIEVTIDVVLGVIFDYFKNLQIYPNPSSDVLTVSYRHLTTDAVKLELVDLTGAVLLQRDLQRGYDQDLTLDVRPFDAGIYLLRIYDSNSREKNVVTYRIMIQD